MTQRSHVVFGRIFLSLPFQLVQRDEIDEGWRVRKKRNKMKKEKTADTLPWTINYIMKENSCPGNRKKRNKIHIRRK